MRENIGLFRAKRIDGGEWVQGYYVKNVNGNQHYIFDSRNNGDGKSEIDPETLCECTGLKDKNGKLIFENDIVDTQSSHGVIIIKDFDDLVEFYYWFGECVYYEDSMVVLGNRFDNPELLERE